MLKIFFGTGRHLVIVAICFASFAMTGCVESSFNLATESKLPRGFVLPRGLTRNDVSVILNLYTPLWGSDAKFELIDSEGKELAEIKGKVKHSSPSPYTEIVVVNGITEVVALKPYEKDENMEQNGIPVARFYVVDDTCARKETLEGGLPACPKNGTNKHGMSQNAAGCPCLINP